MKNTWASIVKKPASIPNTEISPMQVIVPEPPMRGSLMGGNEPPMRGSLMGGNEPPMRGSLMGGNEPHTVNTDTESTEKINKTFKIQSILSSLDSQKKAIETEMKQKKDKFHASYAYTKYMNEMSNLNSEKLLLEKKVHYVQCTLDVMKRIQTYLTYGPTSAQTLTYTVQSTTEPNNKEISWSIKEEIHATTLHIDFLTDSKDMLDILELIINHELATFIKN
jgi:hypothetical protein